MRKFFKDILIIVLLFLLFGFGTYHCNRIDGLKGKHNEKLKLFEALNDSLRYKNKVIFDEKETVVYEKRTLQGKISDLEKVVSGLNNDKEELVGIVGKLNKEKKVINAALIRQGVEIDSLENLIKKYESVDLDNNTITFAERDTTSAFQFDIRIGNVRPYNGDPFINFNKIYFPNKQFISFQYDENERKDYPISFSVTNSNPYYKTFNIESYAIEGLKKESVMPTGWQKFTKWMKINGTYILVGMAGYGVGVVTSR